MLGRLSWAAISFNEPLPLLSGAVVGTVILAVLATVTAKGRWPYLWREWLTSVGRNPCALFTAIIVLLVPTFTNTGPIASALDRVLRLPSAASPV